MSDKQSSTALPLHHSHLAAVVSSLHARQPSHVTRRFVNNQLNSDPTSRRPSSDSENTRLKIRIVSHHNTPTSQHPPTMTVIHIGRYPPQPSPLPLSSTQAPTHPPIQTPKLTPRKSSSNSSPQSPNPTKTSSPSTSRPSNLYPASKTTASSSAGPRSRSRRSAAKGFTTLC